jgi:methylenetetrahydrofolate--tRNA-(uracil-5-)-methyltransferase
MVTIIGGGLAGCEAAWQVASRGVPVTLYEMRPVRATAVHKTDRLAELVCSNSFRGDKLDNAVGLLKEEMRRLGSLIMRAGEASRVPAGALAVDRDRFAQIVTDAVSSHPHITIRREEIAAIPHATPAAPVIVATGPLTSESLSADIVRLVGGEHLYFYDAISPIVLAESIDRTKVFRQSRWDRSFTGAGVRGAGVRSAEVRTAEDVPGAACGIDDGQGDYLNCPFTREADASTPDPRRIGDGARFRQGTILKAACRSYGIAAWTAPFGPMKPVGLVDPEPDMPPPVQPPGITTADQQPVGFRPRSNGATGRRCFGDPRPRAGQCALRRCTATPTSTVRRC